MAILYMPDIESSQFISTITITHFHSEYTLINCLLFRLICLCQHNFIILFNEPVCDMNVLMFYSFDVLTQDIYDGSFADDDVNTLF